MCFEGEKMCDYGLLFQKNRYLCEPFVRTRIECAWRGRLLLTINERLYRKTISIMEQKNFVANENFD